MIPSKYVNEVRLQKLADHELEITARFDGARRAATTDGRPGLGQGPSACTLLFLCGPEAAEKSVR